MLQVHLSRNALLFLYGDWFFRDLQITCQPSWLLLVGKTSVTLKIIHARPSLSENQINQNTQKQITTEQGSPVQQAMAFSKPFVTLKMQIMSANNRDKRIFCVCE